MDNNLLIQYIVVFVILFAIVAWIIYRLFSKKGGKVTGGCCGCALSEKCSKPGKTSAPESNCSDFKK